MFLTKHIPALLCGCIVTAFGSSALAADNPIAKAGNLYFSGERLMGIHSYKEKEKITGNNGVTFEDEDTGTLVTFLIPGNNTTTFLPSTMPRIAVDYAILDFLTIGGTIGFASHSLDRKRGATGQSDPNRHISEFLLAPRVGFPIGFHEIVSIWPRVGLTIANASSTQDNSASEAKFSRTNLNIEAIFGFTLGKNFFIGVGPYLDLGLGGTNKTVVQNGATTVTTEHDAHNTSFGIMVNLGGFVNLK
jgi:hypothetical protein